MPAISAGIGGVFLGLEPSKVTTIAAMEKRIRDEKL
jgi:hypothetical protein